MSGLFDTSVLVGLEQRRLEPQTVPDLAAVSTVTLEELWLGVQMSAPAAQPDRRRTYDTVLSRFTALLVDEPVARLSGEIRAEGRRRGRRYGIADALIGATARVHALPLYTQDEGMAGMLGVDVRVV